MEILLDRLSLHRGGRHILNAVSWHIRPGERWLVAGASGAGKTQLLKVVAGDVWPDASDHLARRYCLEGEWHEQPADVRDELVWLGPERQDRYERYGWNHRAIEVVGTGLYRTDIPLQRLSEDDQAACMRLLRRAGVARFAQRRFLTLSYGERRLVLLARALAWRARILLLDEVATGLDAANRDRLYRLLGTRRLGAGWICSAHRMEDVPPGATHLLWMAQGKPHYAGVMRAAKLREALAVPGPARSAKLRSATSPPVKSKSKSGSATARPVVQLGNAQVWIDGKHILHDINLDVRRGQSWVMHGGNGSGKSTLLRTIHGDHSVAAGGFIRRAGIGPGVPLDDFRQRTGFVAPHLQTDYPRHASVLDTVVSGLHASIGLNFPATPRERQRARAALRALGMQDHAERTLGEMSYGQVRRILFARALVTRPRLLLLDEAFTGLNAEVRADLMHWLETQIAAGITVVMATHYRREWPRNATHELMLSRGRITYAGKLRR
ncbi:MAG: ATP-binding cassette domain-containing protein [Pseudomonadota bacterium]|nr:ATP-binding cassette domain-containing protein [Pseudomonadota bacterium]